MDNNYLIPANANRGKLIMGFFRPIDAILFGCGALATFIGLLLFQEYISSLPVAILVMLPALVTGFLVIPVPNQHNVLVLLTNMWKFFFVDTQEYYWRGWCNSHGEEQSDK